MEEDFFQSPLAGPPDLDLSMAPHKDALYKHVSACIEHQFFSKNSRHQRDNEIAGVAVDDRSGFYGIHGPKALQHAHDQKENQMNQAHCQKRIEKAAQPFLRHMGLERQENGTGGTEIDADGGQPSASLMADNVCFADRVPGQPHKNQPRDLLH